MADYIITEEKNVIESKSMKFIPKEMLPKGVTVDVLDCQWQFLDDFYKIHSNPYVDKRKKRTYERTNVLKLNNLTFIYGRNYKSGRFSFVDSNTGAITTISVHLEPQAELMWGHMYAVNYEISINFQSQRVVSQFYHPRESGNRFLHVPRLYSTEIDGEDFNKGLVSDQFGITLRGHELEGQSYVLFAGCWGIILKDDLSFDSLALFDAVVGYDVYVERFVYTVNPYVTKMMMLTR